MILINLTFIHRNYFYFKFANLFPNRLTRSEATSEEINQYFSLLFSIALGEFGFISSFMNLNVMLCYLKVWEFNIQNGFLKDKNL